MCKWQVVGLGIVLVLIAVALSLVVVCKYVTVVTQLCNHESNVMMVIQLDEMVVVLPVSMKHRVVLLLFLPMLVWHHWW